ncbi:MAG: alpha/beta hydrolase [Pyrinomonadaceae bacterium]
MKSTGIQQRVLRGSLLASLSLLAILMVANLAAAQGTFTMHSDLAYVNDGNPAHTLDLYIPDGATGPIPLIVWIHGGGWQSGDKSLAPNGSQLRYARNGYAVASLNYRLSGEAIFPAQIHDCKAAIRWLRANAAQYNLDVSRFGSWGSSAGGHLAALVGTSNDVVDMEGTVGSNLTFSSRVQATVDWFGPTNLLLMDTQLKAQAGCGNGNHDAANSPESLLIGCPIQTCPAAVQRANPMTYFTIDDPPFFIEHGTADCTVPTGQSQIFQNLLQSFGHDSSITLIATAGHGGPLFMTESNMLLVDAFWEAKLRQPVNPLVSTVQISYKNAAVNSFRPSSLGALYRIKLTGLNLQSDSKVLINGAERGVATTGANEVTVNGLPGRIPAAGEVTVQLRNANGRYSNVMRVAISP